MPGRRINFDKINRAALPQLPDILSRWLPDGERRGKEWCALNPTRPDRRRGSFNVNMETGKWGDFATGNHGRDVISLSAYLFKTSQGQAAHDVARMLAVDPYV